MEQTQLTSTKKVSKKDKFLISSIVLVFVITIALILFIKKPQIKNQFIQLPSPTSIESEKPLTKIVEGVVVKIEDNSIYIKENSNQETQIAVDSSTKVVLQNISIPKQTEQASGEATLLSILKSEQEYSINQIKTNDKVRIIFTETANLLKAQTITVVKEV